MAIVWYKTSVIIQRSFTMAAALYQALKVIVEAAVTAVLEYFNKNRNEETRKQ
jgi:hypothetical protein